MGEGVTACRPVALGGGEAPESRPLSPVIDFTSPVTGSGNSPRAVPRWRSRSRPCGKVGFGNSGRSANLLKPQAVVNAASATRANGQSVGLRAGPGLG